MAAKPRRKSLPKEVVIGPYSYDVTVDKGLDLLGETQNHDSTIVVRRPGQSPDCERDTMLHEVLHATLFVSGLSHPLEHDKEEELVRTLTPWLLAVLRDNPALMAYLLDK